MKIKPLKYVFALMISAFMLINPALPVFAQYISRPNLSAPTNNNRFPTEVLSYSIKELGTLGGNSSFARDINDRGQVTGNANVPNGRLHAYLWEAGVMLDLGFLPNGVEFSRGFSINNGGVVTGESDNDRSKAFVYFPNAGKMTALFDLIMGNPDNLNIAGGFGAGINDRLQIVGTMSRISPSVIRGFIFDRGIVRDLGSIDNLTTTPARAWGINNFGQAVGLSRNSNGVSHATLWQNGTAVDLGSLGGPTAFSEAFRINEEGQTVGRSTVTAGVTGQNAVMWENGQIRDLGRLPGVNFGRANDINNSGTIVGTSSQFEGFSGRAVIWQPGETTPTDLNTRLPPDSGWTLLTSAEGINSAGQIVGFGTINGRTRAFLMTPYDVCLTDERRGITILINSQTGDYRIIDCRTGTITEGKGNVSNSSCFLRLSQNFPNRSRLDVFFDTCSLTGRALIPDSVSLFGNFGTTITDNEPGNSGCGGNCSID